MSKNPWKYLWWPLPKKSEEIQPYIEKKFSLAGDHVWMKILRKSIEVRFAQSLPDGPVPPAVETEGKVG